MKRYVYYFTILLFFLPLHSCTEKKEINLPHLFKLPNFQLINQDGEKYSSTDLQGKVYFASFVFTSCAMSCPKTLAALSSFQTRLSKLPQELRMVTITVDPETDTPERLKMKSVEFKADHSRWVFLTGSLKEIEDLVMNGYKLAMSKMINNLGDTIDVAHSDKFVLVDKNGWVRGLYGRESNEELDSLLEAMQFLLKEKN